MNKTTKHKPDQEDESRSMVEENPSHGLKSIKKEALSQEELNLIAWIKKVRFRKKLLGGVDEQDVWQKIEELNNLFEEALRVERIRYDVLLNEVICKREASSLHTKAVDKGYPTDE